MAFDVSALADYTRQDSSKWITSLVGGSKTIQLLYSEGNVMTGVKSAETLKIFDTNAHFQAGGTCGFNPSGSTTISDRVLTIGKIKVHDKWCPKDLEPKYTQLALKKGSQPTTFDFADEVMNKKADLISYQMEKAVWQGDTNSGNINLNKFDGFLKIINAASASTVNANQSTYVSGAPISAATGMTAGNAVGIINGIWAAIPEEVLDKPDLRIFIGLDKLRTYAQALTTANMYHYNPERSTNNEIQIPGTNQIVTGVQGLSGTNYIIATPMSNLYYGTDMEHEEEKAELFWAKEADELRYMAEWKAGVQIAFPAQITVFKFT